MSYEMNGSIDVVSIYTFDDRTIFRVVAMLDTGATDDYEHIYDVHTLEDAIDLSRALLRTSHVKIEAPVRVVERDATSGELDDKVVKDRRGQQKEGHEQ